MIQFDSDRPIFLQIAQLLRAQILSGQLPAQSRLPSIRELSLQYRVNPNTVQKALALLEEEKLIETRRTQGKFVLFEPDRDQESRRQEALRQVRQFMENMKELGFDQKEVIRIIKEENYDS